MLHNIRRFDLRSVLLLGAGIAAMTMPAAAQNAPAQGETMIVTGSRIPTTNATSVSPVSVATSAQIEETSAFSLEDVLTKMVGPDTTGGIAKNTNNGGAGFSGVGLRNLGPSRTLVLVDGQRLIPTSASGFSTSTPDLNTVPVSMVDRIEVLRDGASSIYGADAIGGVINIITKKDFEGLRVDAYGGTSEHGGADTYTLSATVGVNFDRGNVTFSLMNENQSPVAAASRDWTQDTHPGEPGLQGLLTSFRTQLPVLQDASGADAVWVNGVATNRENSAIATPGSCITYLPGAGVDKLNANCPSIKPGATVEGGLARTQASLASHYDITDDITFTMSGFFTRRNSEQLIRPEPVIGASIASTYLGNGLPVYAGFQVPVYADFGFVANPDLPANSIGDCGGDVLAGGTAQCITANLTPNQFGERTYKQTSDTYRVRVGLEGHVFTDYNWELGYVQQRNDYTQHIYNSGNWLHFAEATGNLPCIDVPGGCTTTPDPRFGYRIPVAPINFYNLSSVTADQWDYLKTTLTDTAFAYENYIYGDINGPIFDLPAGTVQGSVGFERRFEYLETEGDNLGVEGYAASQASTTRGGYGTYSIYGELRVPLLKDMPLVQSLTFTPSARYDHYSNFGDATTYKLGADWQVIDDLRFRGSYNTGFRAPSTQELYGGRGASYVGVDGDPCDSRAAGYNGNSNAGLASLAAGSACYTQLSAMGLTPGQIAAYQSPENNLVKDQRGFVQGGNPALQPEKSHSWTVGLVLTPTFAPGLAMNADYYDVTITNSILTGGIPQNLSSPDVYVLGCYLGTNPDYCANISRNSGGIFQILSLNANTGSAGTSGYDLEMTYDTAAAGFDLPFELPGSVTIDAQAEHQITNYQAVLGSVQKFPGTYLGTTGSVQPLWKSTLFTDYHLEDWTFHYDLQYFGAVTDAGLHTGRGYDVPDYVYQNIAVAYQLPEMGPVKASTISFGINNLFDKDPPFVLTDGNGKNNSLSGPYDFVGRFFYTRLSLKF